MEATATPAKTAADIAKDFGHLTAAPTLTDSGENMAYWLAVNETTHNLETDRRYHVLDDEPAWVAITDRALALQTKWSLNPNGGQD